MARNVNLKQAKKAGKKYAEEQIASGYFQDWVYDQLYEASQMDPAHVLPLETKAHARGIADAMLQQLSWDTQRGLDMPSLLEMSGAKGASDTAAVVKAFYEGFDSYAQAATTRDWLADELLEIRRHIEGDDGSDEHRSGAVRAARKPRHPEMSGGADDFAALLTSLVDTQGRYLAIRTEHRLGGPSRAYESVAVTFVNLPEEIVARKAGGGAEAMNNRMLFWVDGFDGADPHAPPPRGKVTVEMRTSSLPREYKLRKKTGSPGAVAQYLADFLNRVVAEVPPNYTHSTPIAGEARARVDESRRRQVVLYRAAEDDTLPTDAAAFTADLNVARAYLDNPGFGGSTIFHTKVSVDPAKLLDLSNKRDPEEFLAAMCGTRVSTLQGKVDIAIPASVHLQDCLREKGYDWVLVPESYPEDTVTWLWIGPWENEPDLEELLTWKAPIDRAQRSKPIQVAGTAHTLRESTWTHGTFAELFDEDGNPVWVQISKHKSEQAGWNFAKTMKRRIEGGPGRRPKPFIGGGCIIAKGTRFEVRPL